MKTLTVVILAALLCGCASVGNNFDSRKIGEIKKGETTEAELVRMFGPPSQRTVNSETGRSLVWVYTQAITRGATFIPIVGAFAGGMDMKTKSLSVQLDASGRTVSYSFSGGAMDTRGYTESDPEKPASVVKSPKGQ